MILDKQTIKTGDWVWIYFLPIGYSKIASEKRVNYGEETIMALFIPLPAFSGHRTNRYVFPWAFDRLAVRPTLLEASLIQTRALSLSLPGYRLVRHKLLLAALRVATY